MPLQVNIHHLEKKDIHLEGELPAAELQLDAVDELIHLREPLRYDLTVEKLGHSLLAQGSLKLTLHCECARCLKAFDYRIEIAQWAAHLPLDGEERVPVHDDLADLTPSIREDILLELPQHPLCEIDCAGLPNRAGKPAKKVKASQTESSSAWAELNKLKF